MYVHISWQAKSYKKDKLNKLTDIIKWAQDWFSVLRWVFQPIYSSVLNFIILETGAQLELL